MAGAMPIAHDYDQGLAHDHDERQYMYHNNDDNAAHYHGGTRADDHYHSDTLTLASTSSTLVHSVLPLRTLVFDRTDIMDEGTTIHGPGGPLYRVSVCNTVALYGEELRIVRLSGRSMDEVGGDVPPSGRENQGAERIVATIRRRDLLPDLAIFPHRGGRALKVKKWLPKTEGKMPRGEFRWALCTLGGQFTWRSNRAYRFALYPEGEHEPIAYVHKLANPHAGQHAGRHRQQTHLQDGSGTLVLSLNAGYEDIEVEIITSFLVLEHKLRMKEKIEQGKLMLALTGNGFFFGGL